MAFTSETAREAGKKSKKTPFTKKFFDFISEERAAKIINDIVEKAEEGERWAQELCAGYILGKPQQSVDVTTDGDSINRSAFKLPDGTILEI